MNTSGRKFNPQRCSKLGLTFLLLLPAMTTQYSTAKETTINQLTVTTVTSAENVTTEQVFYFVAALTDGSQISIPFAEQPVLTYNGTNLLLTSTKMQLELPQGTVKEFTINKEPVETGIENIGMQGDIQRYGDLIQFSHFPASSPVTIFDSKGQMVLRAQVDANGSCQISLQHLPKGIYIVKTKTITYKLLKK